MMREQEPEVAASAAQTSHKMSVAARAYFNNGWLEEQEMIPLGRESKKRPWQLSA